MKIPKAALNKHCPPYLQLAMLGMIGRSFKHSEVSRICLPYDTLGSLGSRMRTVAPNLLHVDEMEPATFGPSLSIDCTQEINLTPFKAAVENFYMTNSVTKASKIMAQCSAMLLKE